MKTRLGQKAVINKQKIYKQDRRMIPPMHLFFRTYRAINPNPTLGRATIASDQPICILYFCARIFLLHATFKVRHGTTPRKVRRDFNILVLRAR